MAVWILPTLGLAQNSPTGKQANAETKLIDAHGLRPPDPTEILLANSEHAIQNGLDFLVKTQNKDGSWGSHDPKVARLTNFGFAMLSRGSHDAVRTACTAICAQALLKQHNRTPAQQAALEKAIVELTQVRKFAFHGGENFNTWGYGYKLAFLVELQNAPEGEHLREKIASAARSCVDGLMKYQQHTGGWSYYSGVMRNAGSMSFNTAFFALSLHRASKIGIKVPAGMVMDASKAVDRQRVPDGSLVYSSESEKDTYIVLANLGAGSRTISSTLALYETGYYGRRHLLQAMVVFDNGENYLESGRKLIIPHSAVHLISGYFFFFGYNYATAAAEKLGDVVPQQRWDRFTWTMLRTQESNGSWWDTLLYDYGDKWATGFAIQSLQRYVRETNRRTDESPAEQDR